MNYYIEDFTEDNYKKFLLTAKQKNNILFYNEAMTASNAIVLRHDIDFSVHRSFALAQIEAELSVPAVYFVYLHSSFYNVLEKEIVQLLKKIVNMRAGGAKLGLHFDPSYYDLKIGEKSRLIDRAEWEKNLLEEVVGEKVDYISFHNPDVGADWHLLDDEKIGSMLNVYNKYLREHFEYCSDSNGYWRYQRLEDVIKDCEGKKLHLLLHPAWWQREVLYPYDRIKRCVDGRCEKTLKKYLYGLEKDKRVNAKGEGS